MCNCIRDIEERIKKELPIKNKEYENMKINKVKFKDMVIFNGEYETYSTIKLECEYVNKKGTNIIKSIMENFSHEYCPFCGKKYGIIMQR